MDCCSKRRILTSMTSVCACAAFGLLCIAVATDYWLFTSEKFSGNGTARALYTHVYSGLWHKCQYKDTRLAVTTILRPHPLNSHCILRTFIIPLHSKFVSMFESSSQPQQLATHN
ncbi:hypothetical protein C0Q70_01359 [Pomacea canaliculata]|uniref:Uncharacterized protein n=1 Tax=Pomacea canaliculata TaxID=400727 RepID=A0A2T7PZB3_POMCA|nr:hypothetical protein C0Q70_01359 [Pomacea canaliculata]